MLDEGPVIELAECGTKLGLGRLLRAVSHGMEFLGKTGMPDSEVAAVGRSAALALLGAGPAGKAKKKRASRR